MKALRKFGKFLRQARRVGITRTGKIRRLSYGAYQLFSWAAVIGSLYLVNHFDKRVPTDVWWFWPRTVALAAIVQFIYVPLLAWLCITAWRSAKIAVAKRMARKMARKMRTMGSS